MDGAVLDGFFECRSVLLANARREVDNHRKLGNPPRSLGGHVFFDFDFEPGQIEVFMTLSIDAHDRRNATGQRRSQQIGRRKRFAFSVVVHRGIGRKFATTWLVDGFTAEGALVFDIDFDHLFFFSKRGLGFGETWIGPVYPFSPTSHQCPNGEAIDTVFRLENRVGRSI